ncbi:hypothetical protein FRC17_010091 [Serendipita sp. 399]|nr:hypothetical protein FRC17_010091 [Serendipita sp. 399]
MLKGMFNVWLHTWRTIFHVPRASTHRIHQFIAEEGTNAPLEIPLQHQDEYVPSPSSKPASRILITYIDRNQDHGVHINDDFDTSPDDLDLHIVYTMVEDPHSNIPLESMLEVLRRAIYNRPTFQESDLMTKGPTLSHIINRATQIVLACRTYKNGYLDILPGVPLNKATLVMQFFEAAIQIVDFEPEGRSACWEPLLEMADVLMDRALRGQSLDELVLHASLSIRLQLKLNLHTHLTRAPEVLKALRILGPAPQEFRMTVWPPEEILKYQKVISPYIYSLSLMVLRRYSSSVENAASTTTTVTAALANPPTIAPTITQAKQLPTSTSLGRKYTPLEDLADHTSNILAAGRIPARFGRSADNYRTLRDVLGEQWINNAGCNADVAYWMRQVLLYTGLAPEVAEDGSHYLKKCFA